METVLVVGATGNVGVSVIIAALRSKRNVLAVVRNQLSADKIYQHTGMKDGITVVEADVTSEHGVQEVVDRVKAGQLPAFQHVYSTVGIYNPKTPMQNIDPSYFRQTMNINLEANFFAYRATIPYLIEQGNPHATWTLITGGAGEAGSAGVTAISQGALFSMANAACLENATTNIRFNEVYLCYRVDFDTVCERLGGNRIKSSDFARVYEGILANKDISGCRVSVYGPQDLDNLKYEKKPVGLASLRARA
ncbi:uncharacterized protein Z518_04316 [Rhinocladiella mackenziei CBS 650.93]|uniref:Uncharacterized protein n=1 Tax=Rhinocladiella mackenziei CBS 650.93 TaxID=1442369 RepID=A0A0D2JB55_9EURO|nr:uncharacterized protein Z518_04316 [Rhinocladiella mackenziei CBS 650.93]KIX06340.1 hypothetical protein Z518_04316 [Rhinocladiella mackenziei CBS 650.93]